MADHVKAVRDTFPLATMVARMATTIFIIVIPSPQILHPANHKHMSAARSMAVNPEGQYSEDASPSDSEVSKRDGLHLVGTVAVA